MKHIQGSGLEMPDEFDVTAYDEINVRAVEITRFGQATDRLSEDSYRGFASAWNGVAIRFRSAMESDADFKQLISPSAAVGHETNYRQERALF